MNRGYAYHSAKMLQLAFKRGDLAPVDVIRELLERISAHSSVRAWEFVDHDAAMRAAQGADVRSPLGGIPIGIKDIIDTSDMPTTYGSRRYQGHTPKRDAWVVRAIRAAGGVVIGKTVTTEFAAVYRPAATVNPLDASRTPGGSSSGSAAAVADFTVPLAVGTQTAGSVLRPAAYCGIFGFKPTYGLIPMEGVRPVSPSLDTIGFLARTVDDIELVLLPILPRFKTVRAEGARYRVAFIRTDDWDRASLNTRRALEVTADVLRSQGAIVDEPSWPTSYEDLGAASVVVMEYEAARSLGSEHTNQLQEVSAPVADLVKRGLQHKHKSYQDALALAREMEKNLMVTTAGYDFILTPCVLDEPPALDSTGDPLFLKSWTLLGWPAISVPGHRGDSGLPVGIQLVGFPRRDSALLAASRWVSAVLHSNGVA